MKKILVSILLLLGTWGGFAQTPALKGFAYDQAEAPTGKEWESPEELALNKEQPRAWFFTFADVESARRVLPEHSSYYQSLNGDWKFHWVGNPDERPADFYKPEFDVSGWDDVTVPMQWNVAGIQKDGSLKYGVPIYANQPVIFQHKVAVGDWKGGVMRTPPQDWVTYKHRNEVGSYRRSFTVPAGWEGREVYINFDGVSSFFYLWINGHYVGFSKNSRNTASFDITPYLNGKGDNVVAVEVYRNSDGSFLEAQDMFRLPGIFRTVSLTSTAQVQVRDFRVFPSLDANYEDGTLRIEADLRNLGKKKVKGYTLTYSLYANKLYSDDNELVEGVGGTYKLDEMEKGGKLCSETEIAVPSPRKWSAEAPVGRSSLPLRAGGPAEGQEGPRGGDVLHRPGFLPSRNQGYACQRRRVRTGRTLLLYKWQDGEAERCEPSGNQSGYRQRHHGEADGGGNHADEAW